MSILSNQIAAENLSGSAVKGLAIVDSSLLVG